METSQSVLRQAGETSSAPVIVEHIVSTDDTCGGAPRIADTRTRVKDVAIWHIHQALSVEGIVAKWPHLSRAGVHAALAYYYDHQNQIEAEIVADEAAYEDAKAKTPSLVREKLAQLRSADAGQNPLSS